MVDNVRKGLGGNLEEILSIEKYKWKELRETLALRNTVKEEERLEIHRRLKEELGTKPYLYGPLDYAKTLV